VLTWLPFAGAETVTLAEATAARHRARGRANFFITYGSDLSNYETGTTGFAVFTKVYGFNRLGQAEIALSATQKYYDLNTKLPAFKGSHSLRSSPQIRNGDPASSTF
jgi:hypothetical protein